MQDKRETKYVQAHNFAYLLLQHFQNSNLLMLLTLSNCYINFAEMFFFIKSDSFIFSNFKNFILYLIIKLLKSSTTRNILAHWQTKLCNVTQSAKSIKKWISFLWHTTSESTKLHQKNLLRGPNVGYLLVLHVFPYLCLPSNKVQD